MRLAALLLLLSAAGAQQGVCRAGDAGCGKYRLRGRLRQGDSLHFCVGCASAEEGSLVETYESAFVPAGYDVEADLVFTVPNNATRKPLNAHQVKHNIAVMYRGDIPLVHKIINAQKAGAVGAVIVDDGSCGPGFACGRLGTKGVTGGFAKVDMEYMWRDVRIPAVLVSAQDGERLRSLMFGDMMLLKHWGWQFVEDD